MAMLDRDVAADLRVLDAMSLRAKVALHNLANQDTPGYQRYEVRFEDLLQKAGRDGVAADDVLAQVERVESGPPGVNNVDSMAELTTLLEARLTQQLFLRRAAAHYDRLRLAIGGGG